MKKLLAVAVALVVCVCLGGCEDMNDSNNTEVKIIGNRQYITFKWVDKEVKKDREFYIAVGDWEKLKSFADTLEKCSGKYEVSGTWQGSGQVYKEMRPCSNVLPTTMMTQEFNNGYICKRCLKYRQEELKKKAESLQKGK